MADIKLTTADTAGFIPQFWANRALDVLRSQIVLANLVARDSNFAEAGWKGKSITIPYPGTFNAVDKAADTPVTPQVPAGGQSVTLTLNKHKVVPFLIEDFGAAQANMSLMDRYIHPAVVALAEQFETDLWGTTQGLTVSTGTPGTDITAANVRSARKLLNDNKAPMADRWLVVSTKDEIALLGDTTLSTFFAYSQPRAYTNGYLGRLYGLDVYMSQLVPLGYQVAIGGGATAGTFKLTFNAVDTANITYASSLTAATVQAALVAASTVGTGNATVSGPNGGPYMVNFIGALEGTTLALSSSTGAGSLTGGTPTLAVNTATRNTAFHKNGIMFATRPFPEPPANSGVMTAQAHDPESGLSIRISTQYDINNVGMRCNLDMLYGTQALRPTQGVVITN